MADVAGNRCAIAERDFVAAWWLLADAGGSELHDDAGVRWFHSGAEDRYANGVVRTRLHRADADGEIDRVVTELRARGAPFQWWVLPSDEPANLVERLEAHGLVAGDRWPAFLLEIDAMVEPPPVRGLEIRRVVNEADFAAYLSVMAPILSPSDAFTAFFAAGARGIGFGPDGDELHFLGLLDGTPVATSSVLLAGGAAGIYNVTTAESVRGRGIGAAVTAAAIRAGAARGMRVASLQASDMGRSVYERLGFTYVCEFRPYRLP